MLVGVNRPFGERKKKKAPGESLKAQAWRTWNELCCAEVGLRCALAREVKVLMIVAC